MLDHGADLYCINNQGLGPVHIAAQSDQPLIIAYLYEIGLDVSLKDNKGSTPLHWACYMGCEISATLLSALGSDVNFQDLDGHSPLHLATIAGNSRIIRNLLIKGASRQLKVRP